MTEYVNKAELFKQRHCHNADRGCTSAMCDVCSCWEVSRSLIDELPTIDLVHCDECKFWKGGGGVLNAINGGIYHWCEKGHKDASPNWFCADGERK